MHLQSTSPILIHRSTCGTPPTVQSHSPIVIGCRGLNINRHPLFPQKKTASIANGQHLGSILVHDGRHTVHLLVFETWRPKSQHNLLGKFRTAHFDPLCLWIFAGPKWCHLQTPLLAIQRAFGLPSHGIWAPLLPTSKYLELESTAGSTLAMANLFKVSDLNDLRNRSCAAWAHPGALHDLIFHVVPEPKRWTSCHNWQHQPLGGYNQTFFFSRRIAGHIPLFLSIRST